MGLFAPVQVGGQAAYAIISGNSMEPGLHRGDLVVLRQASDYQVGDIATYRHPTLGPVIHRIVAEADGQFVFKGDNNAWLDSYQPTQAEMIGRFWLYAPSAGRIVEQMRQPWAAALLVALGGLAIAITGSAELSRSRVRQRRRLSTSGKWAAVTRSLRGSQADLLFLLATLGVASLLLGFFAFTRPLTRTAVDDVKYQQAGSFSYAAAAPPGIYEGNAAKTGEPIFRRLISRVNVVFDYRLQAEQAESLEGTSRLTAVLSGNNGWRSAVELQGESAFRGSSARIQGTLDLPRLQAILDDLQQQTGVRPSQYTLAIVPSIAISGTLAGQPLRDTFSPQLLFALDELQMQLMAQQKNGSNGSDPLQPSESKSVRQSREAVNTISFLGLSLAVPTARSLAVIGLALSLLGAGALVVATRGGLAGDEEARIRAKYGAQLVSVHDSGLLEGRSLVEVATIDDLAKIAERSGRMILHRSDAGGQVYFVQDDDIVFSYRVASGAQAGGLPAKGG